MKKGKFLLIIIFFIFCTPNIVLADANEVTCSDIRNKYNEYEGVINEYNSLVCDTVTDAETYNQCVNLVMKKNSIIEELYSLNDKNSSCNIDEVTTLLEDNEDKCSSSLSSDLKDFANTVMNFFYMIAPFLLIIFGSIDFFKIIVNGDPKTIQKNRTNFFRRLIAFVLLYFTPFITKQILSLSVYDLTGNKYICTTEVVSPVGNTNTEGPNRILYSGYYGIDNSMNYDADAGGKILRGADQVAKTWLNSGFVYFDSAHPLRYYDINASINNPSKGTCCATLVAAALYKSTLFSESEISSLSYNGAYYIADFLDKKGWMIIDNYSTLQPGDIVFMVSSANAPITLSNGRTYTQGHVQIYAGSGKWYNAGSTEAIQRSQPYPMGDDYVRGRFSFAMRSPARTPVNRANQRSTPGASTAAPATTDTSSSTTPSTNTNTSTKQNTTNKTNTNTSSTTKGTNTKSTTGSSSSTTSSTSSTKKKKTK